jgi:tRNA threonylcarbamoyladenosine biosynthesis protein TsaB
MSIAKPVEVREKCVPNVVCVFNQVPFEGASGSDGPRCGGAYSDDERPCFAFSQSSTSKSAQAPHMRLALRVPPLLLAIETSNPSAAASTPGVALVDATSLALVAREPLAPLSAQHDDLMSAVDRCFARAHAQPRDLRSIAVSIGPGGFTNVRIAVTCARFLAETTGCDLVGVPSAHVAAIGTPRLAALATASFAVGLASKGDTVHVSRFSAGGSPVDQGRLCGPADIAQLGVGLLIADSFLPPVLRAAAQAAGMAIIEPALDALACAQAAAMHPKVEPASLMPIYPREPEAVTKWRQLHEKR